MPSQFISVSTFNQVDVKEDLHTEFKTSIFIDAETQTPGIKQMLKIARTLAAFMNTEGGMLYVGVTDDKQIRGIAEDFAILAHSPDIVAIHNTHYNDEGFQYGASEDKYELKIRAIARAFLGSNAGAYIKSVLIRPMGGMPVCRIDVTPCKPDEFVYFFGRNTAMRTEEAQIYIRSGNHNKMLFGSERDEFVRKRIAAEFNAQMDAVRASVAAASAGTGYEAVMDSVRELIARLDGQRLDGPVIGISGGQPFTEEAVTAAKKPKSLAWDGVHYAEVSGWQELVLKVLEKLQEINAAKFDELAEQKEFSKVLIKIAKPKEKHPDCYPTKFGAEGKIRIKSSLGNKVYLWQEDKNLRKIIAAFGVDVLKFMFVPREG